jgi:hypothetical protein
MAALRTQCCTYLPTQAHIQPCVIKKKYSEYDACNGVETRELMLIVATRFVCDGRSNSKTARIQETELTVTALITVAYFSKTNYSRPFVRRANDWLTVGNSQLLSLMTKRSHGICENRSSGKNLELGHTNRMVILKVRLYSQDSKARQEGHHV